MRKLKRIENMRVASVVVTENGVSRPATAADLAPVRNAFRAGMKGHRPLHVIAAEITADRPKFNHTAQVCLNAMYSLNTVDDEYMCDTGRDVVLYFLSNASAWRGEVAKRIKNELKGMLN